MNNNLFWNLVLKDLRLYRIMIGVAVAAGMMALTLLPQGSIAFFVGSSLALCALIILLITLVQMAVIGERKSQTHYFMLSLPITGRQYVFAKIVAMAFAFFVPWLLIGGGALLLISLGPVKGFIPFAVTVLMYFPLYFACVIAAAVARKAEAWSMGVIVFFNIAINMFIPGLLRIPSVATTANGPVAIWTPELLLVLAIEIVTATAVLVFALWSQGKKTEYL
ncbi:MAG TPA: ABC-2 transporter permease [Candidatus Acidoferrum sp.]|nr:ABC-2 transporter permease [Candidatus Acidoferrum sp.]